jgi:alcohol dehydrogenase (cytochrome c)
VGRDSGEIKAHFQYTPHDVWDYDSTMEHILFDLDGQKLAAHFDKNGFLYILDRTDMSRSGCARSSIASTGARSTRRAT